MNSMWIIIALVAIAMLITRAKEAYAYKWRGRHNAGGAHDGLRAGRPFDAPGWRLPDGSLPDGQMNEWGQRYGDDVQLFTGKRFDGMRTDFPGGPPGRSTQYANVLAYRPDGDNAVRSMRVPIGHVVRVYTEPNFQGRSGVFAAGDHRLSWRWANNIASLAVVQGNLDYVTSGSGVTGL